MGVLRVDSPPPLPHWAVHRDLQKLCEICSPPVCFEVSEQNDRSSAEGFSDQMSNNRPCLTIIGGSG
ncbi:hypothetical protein CgunFtcFv8_009239 [Champsocephalus gunnari]|uniref:Uncharacterized protein n=1 Tax=Champsocephalus gunnari TaxID=52237 RepID=A0AAN8C1U3_CHAGU|nr:hypothetical protein CgunFtcFv8_009239 [Champsocephalus gunnari]